MRHPKLLEILNCIVSVLDNQEVLLYGSQVRGNANDESDIDLMCFDAAFYSVLLPLIVALEQKYKVPITLQWGNKEQFLTGKTAFWRSLRKEAVSVQDFLNNFKKFSE